MIDIKCRLIQVIGASRTISARGWTGIEGAAMPLGVSRTSAGDYNFALYSKHASAVTLMLFGKDDVVNPIHVHRLGSRVNKSGRIWHCRVAGAVVKQAVYYSCRVEGPGVAQEGAISDWCRAIDASLEAPDGTCRHRKLDRDQGADARSDVDCCKRKAGDGT